MSIGQRKIFTPLAIAAGFTLAAGIILSSFWLIQGGVDERPLRSRLAEMGVIATLDSDGRSIGSVNLASIKDTSKFGEAFEIVMRLKKISSLSLNTMPVTNSDLEKIAQLTSLVTLSLCDCDRVGGAGYAPLNRIGDLQYLHLPGTQTTDEDLQSLGELESLASIDLSRTKVHSDLSPLAQLPRLKWLLFTGDNLGDGALSGLAGAPALTRVTLVDAQHSETDLQALHSAKPNLKIDK